MENRHVLSDEQFTYLIELWNRYHHTKHIRTIFLTDEEASIYEKEAAQTGGPQGR